MSIVVGDIKFDRIRHDEDADVLYLGVEGVRAAHWEESPEGHALRFDADGRLCGITFIGLSHHVGENGRIKVTIPESVDLRGLDDLVPA